MRRSRQIAPMRCEVLGLGQRLESKNPAATPIGMGYLNPILQYGFERFCEAAARCGVDGLILPDLPIYEFETEYGPVMRKLGPGIWPVSISFFRLRSV